MNAKNIKISCLTLLYRHEGRLVRQCLESLRTQSLKECEFILIDNGADEVNKELIGEYIKKDGRFREVHLQENVGAGAALNRGMEEAQGAYIGFLESDDFVETTFFADLLSRSCGGKMDVIKSLYRTLDEAGNTRIVENFPWNQYHKILSQNECRGLIQGHVSHWSGIYRTDFLYSNNIKFNETPGGHSQDFGFMISVYAFAKNVYVIPHAYVTYRIFTGNHKPKYLNDCMLDECELTFKKLQNEQLGEEFWNVVYKRVAPRLKICIKTSNYNQKLRIKRLLRRIEKLQTYKYFRPHERNEIESFIHRNIFSKFQSFLFSKEKTLTAKRVTLLGTPFEILAVDAAKTVHSYFWGIFKTRQESAEYKCYLFGFPLFAKLDTAQEKYLKILGIPFYYKKDVQVVKKILNQMNYLDRKISNLKVIIEVQKLHEKTFGKYKNAFAGKDVVLVCTGPTAKKYKPIKNAIHVGVNGAIYLNNVALDYLFVQDYTIHQKHNSTLNRDALEYKGNNCKKFWGIIPEYRLKQIRRIN